MRTTRNVALILASLTLAACSSSAGSAPATSAVAAAPSTASAPAASPLATADLTCTDFALAATHLTSRMQIMSANNGTANDPAATFDELAAATDVLTAMAPQCAPDGAADIAAVVSAIDALKAAYRPATDQATVDANRAAILAVAAVGVPAWKKLGIDPTGWIAVK